MLTIKQITDNTDAVIRGLEKKHFKNAKETIEQVLETNNKRRNTQTILDKNLSEVNSLSKSIGMLMKEGKKDEAETAKNRVAELKEANKALQEEMDQAATDLQNLLYTIPNVPYDSVPEGVGADDNVVEKMGGMETELPKDALPHWELAKKYDLIDFDLGVKITGAGFPVYKGKGAQLQRALINFFLDEARKSGYTEIMPPTVVNAASGQLNLRVGQYYLYLVAVAPYVLFREVAEVDICLQRGVYRYGYLSRRERHGEVELLLQERAFQLHLVVVRYNLVHLIFSRVQLGAFLYLHHHDRYGVYLFGFSFHGLSVCACRKHHCRECQI